MKEEDLVWDGPDYSVHWSEAVQLKRERGRKGKYRESTPKKQCMDAYIRIQYMYMFLGWGYLVLNNDVMLYCLIVGKKIGMTATVPIIC